MGEKTFEFPISAEKSVSILVKTSEFLRFCASNPPPPKFSGSATGGSQTKISSFFGPCHPIQDGAPASHSPPLMGTPPVSEDQTNADPCCSHSPITPEDDVQDANRAELMIISVSD